MLRTHRKHVADAQPAKILRLVGQRLGLHLVHRKKQRLASALQQPRQFVVRPRQLRAHIHHHHQHVRFFQRHLRLHKDFCCDELRIVGHNAAHIHQPVAPPRPLVLAINTVARNARLVAHNRAPAPGDPVEERAFAHVGPPHNRHQGQMCSSRARGHNRSAIRGQNLLLRGLSAPGQSRCRAISGAGTRLRHQAARDPSLSVRSCIAGASGTRRAPFHQAPTHPCQS